MTTATTADRYDWAGMVCGCGQPATHVPELLIRLATEGEASGITRDSFEGHLHIPSHTYAPAPAAISVALAALADPDTPGAARDVLVDLVFTTAFVDCIGHGVPEGVDLEEECRRAVTPGLEALYAEIASGRSAATASRAFWIAEGTDEDASRVERVRREARHLLWDACQTPWE
ncbi:hypothetical protein ACIA8O_34535 [Kitasatospora sp. NPDC051853]|uniref:hypothetical protein n=1 Tax=Kitasatospora sp. NPDC051853 TaxID=3364058 RepID=UPI0037B4BD22